MTMRTQAGDGFDLTREPWIRVLLNSGENAVLSVREVFARASEIHRLSGESPQQDAAMLRLLLVVFWRAHRMDERLSGFSRGGMSAWWRQQFAGEETDASLNAVTAYLDEVAPRWDLVHPTQPFMQVADLTTLKGEHSTVRKLIPDAESSYFSLRAADGLHSLDLAEAARWLVHLHAWNYSGIKSGAVGDERVSGGRGYPIGTGWSGRAGTVILHGQNLAQSLVLNTPARNVFGESAEKDRPVWERTSDTAAARGPQRAAGPADLLTWQSRRVRLFVEEGRVTGVLVANGDRIESQNEMSDPMTAYRLSDAQSKKAGRDVWMPRAHNETRTLWRGIEPLLAHSESTSTAVQAPQTVTALRDVRARGEVVQDTLVTVELVGTVYGTQDAVVTATVHEELPLRLSLILDGDVRTAQAVISAAQATMEAAIALGQFSAMLRQAAGRDYEFDADATESALARFDEPFKDWLARFTPEEDAMVQRDHWFRLVNDLLVEQAKILTAGAGQAAVIGREDDDDRLHSAATAWSLFRHRLQKTLGESATSRRGERTSR